MWFYDYELAAKDDLARTVAAWSIMVANVAKDVKTSAAPLKIAEYMHKEKNPPRPCGNPVCTDMIDGSKTHSTKYCSEACKREVDKNRKRARREEGVWWQ